MSEIERIVRRRSLVARVLGSLYFVWGLFMVLAGRADFSLLGMAAIVVAFSEMFNARLFLRDPVTASRRGTWDQIAMIGLAVLYIFLFLRALHDPAFHSEMVKYVTGMKDKYGAAMTDFLPPEEYIREFLPRGLLFAFVILAIFYGLVGTFYMRTTRLLADHFSDENNRR